MKKTFLVVFLCLTYPLAFSMQPNIDAMLINALRNGNANEIGQLIARGANVNMNTNLGTPLTTAIVFGRLDVVRVLLAYGANPNLVNIYKGVPLSALMMARQERLIGDNVALQIAAELIEYGANIKSTAVQKIITDRPELEAFIKRAQALSGKNVNR